MNHPDTTPVPAIADFAPERTADDRVLCPADCGQSFASLAALSRHHAKAHSSSIACDLVGESAWCAYLDRERAVAGRALDSIAEDFGVHIGRTTITRDCDRFGYDECSPSPAPKHGAARLLVRPDITTIEEARRAARTVADRDAQEGD